VISKSKKARVIKEARLHDTDTGSAQAQISILTARIDELAKHLKKNPKDNHSRRGLLGMVAARQTHMKYLEKKKPKAYASMAKKIGLKK
jgi:small subunit ribosomal protein S15